ncbi:MAG: pyridoxamine 5'-phosphate oxidase [Ignavibacteria bacterium]
MVTTRSQLEHQRSLMEQDVAPDPIAQFRVWFDEAWLAGVPDAHAMTLATSTRSGDVSARVVFLKGFDERGFCFYTNYRSRKGRELEENPRAALVFFWQPLERQVRIEGTVSKLTEQESDEYFHSRPVASQIGALVSAQSSVIPHRTFLDERFKELWEQYKNAVVPRPQHWGGYRVAPHTIEFWQGRENRLHDRLVYRRNEHGGWLLERLAP